MPEMVSGKRVPPDAWCAKGNYGTGPGMRQLATCGPNSTQWDSPEREVLIDWRRVRVSPTPVFLQKSVDLLEDKGLDFFGNAKELITV
jgi:hypothetical protein